MALDNAQLSLGAPSGSIPDIELTRLHSMESGVHDNFSPRASREKGKGSMTHPAPVTPDEKGKGLLHTARSRIPDSPDRRSANGDGASSSHSHGNGSPVVTPRRTSSVSNMPTPPNPQEVTTALKSRSPEAQIRALRKLRIDHELCRSLMTEDQGDGVDLLVKLLRPVSRLGWLPAFGSSDVNTNAAAAVASLTEHADSRARVAAGDGIQGLVRLLNTGSSEAQSYAAQALGNLAEDTSIAFQVGRAGACAPLVRMLTSASPLSSSVISLQMKAEHEGALAHAANTLAKLSVLSSNQAKIAEAGGIAPLVLLLSTESPHLQAAAAQCLHNLANDAERRAVIVEAGAVPVLQELLKSKDAKVQARAAEAIGLLFPNERVAADVISTLLEMLLSEQAETRVAGSRALGSLAIRSSVNKVKIGGEEECIPALIQQMLSAEMQLKLAAALKALIGFNTGEQPLMALLDGVLGRQGVRSLAKLGTQVGVPLNNNTDVPVLVAALTKGAEEEQLAVARLLASLTMDNFCLSRVMEAGSNCLLPLARLMRSESVAVQGKAAAALSHIAANDPHCVRRTACEEALVQAAATPSEAQVPALRCILNLSDSEECLEALVTAGCVPVLVKLLKVKEAETKKLVTSSVVNLAVSAKCREMIVASDGIPALVAVLGSKQVDCQGAAAAALWQLSFDPDSNALIGAANGPQAAVQALRSPGTTVQENAAGLVASLASDRHNAVTLLNEGVVPVLVALLKAKAPETQAYATDGLRLLAGLGLDAGLLVGEAALPQLSLMLRSSHAEVQQAACGCLAALATIAENREAIGRSGLIPYLVQLLKLGLGNVKVAAAVALTNLSLNNNENLKEFVRVGGVSPLKQLLTSGSPSARKAAQGALSQLAGDVLPIPVQTNCPQYSSDDPGEEHSPGLSKRKSWRSPSMLPFLPDLDDLEDD